MSTLTTPVALERVYRELWWVQERRGITLMKTDGVWSQVRYPLQEDVSAHTDGETVFLGGHEYEVDADLEAELIASGVVTSENFS